MLPPNLNKKKYDRYRYVPPVRYVGFNNGNYGRYLSRDEVLSFKNSMRKLSIDPNRFLGIVCPLENDLRGHVQRRPAQSRLFSLLL